MLVYSTNLNAAEKIVMSVYIMRQYHMVLNKEKERDVIVIEAIDPLQLGIAGMI